MSTWTYQPGYQNIFLMLGVLRALIWVTLYQALGTTNLHSLKLSLSIPSSITFLLPNTAGENNDEDVKESNETGGDTHKVDVVADKLFDHVGAADLEHILLLLCTVLDFSSHAAGVRDVCAPVGGVLDAAALKIVLDVVPCGGDLFMIDLAVVGHGLLHGDAEVSTEEVGSESSANLSDEDEDDDKRIGVDQAFVFTEGATAAKEGDDKDEGANDDEENGGVDVAICEELIESFIDKLYIGSKPNECKPGQSDEQIENE